MPISNPNIQCPKSKKEYDIHKRIFSFVISVLNILKILPKTQQNLIFINQITRSVTSIGANSQEADGSTSRKEFQRSFTIAKKEAKETNYWLQIILVTNNRLENAMKSIIQEGKEIEAIISAIVQKGKV